jgi:calcineurin-like phosphoesterase family protein
VAQPAKEAAAILDGVNIGLEAKGFKPVSEHVIYRRLKKFSRS